MIELLCAIYVGNPTVIPRLLEIFSDLRIQDPVLKYALSLLVTIQRYEMPIQYIYASFIF